MNGKIFMGVCAECNREFDLLDETDASEWAYGHDCEPVEETGRIYTDGWD